MKAKHLRILVIREGEEKVNLSMPAASARWIIELMSDEILAKIKNQGIDLEQIQQSLKSQDEILAQNIFELITDEKKIKVWLE